MNTRQNHIIYRFLIFKNGEFIRFCEHNGMSKSDVADLVGQFRIIDDVECQKKCHATEEQALMFQKMTPDKNIKHMAYYCDICQAWHITTKGISEGIFNEIERKFHLLKDEHSNSAVTFVRMSSLDGRSIWRVKHNDMIHEVSYSIVEGDLFVEHSYIDVTSPKLNDPSDIETYFLSWLGPELNRAKDIQLLEKISHTKKLYSVDTDFGIYYVRYNKKRKKVECISLDRDEAGDVSVSVYP